MTRAISATLLLLIQAVRPSPDRLSDALRSLDTDVVPAEESDAFASDPDELWRTVLARKGGRYALLASMPFDPTLN